MGERFLAKGASNVQQIIIRHSRLWHRRVATIHLKHTGALLGIFSVVSVEFKHDRALRGERETNLKTLQKIGSFYFSNIFKFRRPSFPLIF